MHRTPLLHRARVGAPVVALLLALALPHAALAHSELVSTTPADGALLTESPTEFVGTYTEGLTTGSSIVIKDASGTTVAEGGPASAGDTTITVALPALAPGAYTVESTAIANDGHAEIKRQTLTFTVAEPTPPPPTATPAPTDEPTPEPTATEAPSPTPAATPDPGTTGSGGLDVVLPIAIVALVLGLGLAMLLRRRPA